jgi:peptidylprolyl isomerase
VTGWGFRPITAGGRSGARCRRSGPGVIIQLMNGPWSQGWIGNIRKLAAAHWWDGTSVNRVQDGYVVQWGDPLGMTRPAPSRCRPDCSRSRRGLYADGGGGPGLFRASGGRWGLCRCRTVLSGLADCHRAGDEPETWPVHCYGRSVSGATCRLDSGSGAELYAVIGTPRQLDRNIAVVGRVISGMRAVEPAARQGRCRVLPEARGAHGDHQHPAGKRCGRAARVAAFCRPTARVLPPISMRGPIGAIRSTCGLPAVDICNVPVPVRVTPAR